MNKNVFIVHGHNHKDRDELIAVVSGFGLKPRVLGIESKFGGTIIEEFERLARDCVFALVLLTPDDKQAAALGTHEKYRARQNVIFEMGWFFRSLGRHRTRLIYKGSVELPSDVTGILYIRYRSSVSEVAEKIRDALAGGGVLIDD